MRALDEQLERELSTPAPTPVARLAAALADPTRDAAILYYGSTLRTSDLSGVLDFYRLTKAPHRRGLRGLVERVLWPEVSYHEIAGLKVKVATLPLATFARAAAGRTLDTTIWARFVQPCQRVWAADETAERAVTAAVGAAVGTAARFAAELGPDEAAPPLAFWAALFRRTYGAEFRMETAERADTVVSHDAGRYERILPLAWDASGVPFARDGAKLRPTKRGLSGWALRSAVGKPLNVARILKAAFTFDGAARYAAYKIARHTGVEITVTPWRERHPFLAAPGAWLELRRRRRAAGRAEALKGK